MDAQARRVVAAGRARGVDPRALDLLVRELQQGRSVAKALATLRERGLDPQVVAYLSQVASHGGSQGTPQPQPGGLRSTAGSGGGSGGGSSGGSSGGSGGKGAGGEGSSRIGPYLVENEISRGGMGVVFRARHETLGRRVAIKVLLAGKQASARAVERFATEARAVARLRHPNIVGIHEVGQDALGPYLVMDLIEGESLGVRLRRESPLEPRDAARIAQRIADALAYAHGSQILHRDVKPDNVLLDADEVPVLTDFGLARELDVDTTRLTREGQLVGTPAYTPPEQLLGRTAVIDARSDVYALGATLYEMLSGSLPFPQTEQLALAQAIVEREPEPPSSHAPGVDRDLDTICLTCLEKDPADRYPTAEAVALDLQRWLNDLPIAARPPGLVERLRKWTRRNLALAASLFLALTLGVLGLVVGAGLFVGEAREERDRARVARVEAQQQRDEAIAAREAVVAAQGELEAQNRVTEEELARSNRLLGHALEQKGLRATEARDWRSAAGFYAAALEREETLVRRARLGAALERAWTMKLLPGSKHTRDWRWSPDGEWLAACPGQSSLRVWRATGEEQVRFDLRRTQCLAWSPDGARVAVGGGRGELWIVEVGSGELLEVRAHKARTRAVHWLGAQQLATRGSGGDVAVWSAEGKLRSRRQVVENTNRNSSDWASWGWKGTVAVLAPWKGEALRWDAASDTLTQLGLPTLPFMKMAHTPRGQFLYTGKDLWWFAKGQAPLSLAAELKPIASGNGGGRDLASSRDGRWVVKAQRGELLLWDLDQEPPTWRQLWAGVSVKSHAWSPNGRELAATDGTVVRSWSGETLREANERRGLRGAAGGLAWEPGGERLVAFDGQDLVLWRQGRSEAMARLTGATSPVRFARWSPAGRRLASSGRDGLRVWAPPASSQALKGQLQAPPGLGARAPGHWLPGDQLAFLPTDRRQGKSILIFDTRSGALLRRVATRGSRLEGVSPEGRYLIASGPGAEVFDTQTWERVGAFRVSRGRETLWWSPTQARLAVSLKDEVQLRDPAGEVLLEQAIAREGERLSALAWSPDGNQLAGTVFEVGRSGNRPFQLWVLDLERGEVRRGVPDARAFKLGQEVFWSRDGRFVVTSTSVQPTETLRVWDSASLEEVHQLRGRSTHSAKGAFGERLLGFYDGERLLVVDPERWEAEPLALPCTRAFRWAPSGDVLALVLRDWVQLRDARSGALIYEEKAPKTTSLRWSPDGDRLLLQGYDRLPRLITIPSAKGRPAELSRRVARELGLKLVGLDLVPADR